MSNYEFVDCVCGHSHAKGSHAYERHIVQGKTPVRRPQNIEYLKGARDALTQSLDAAWAEANAARPGWSVQSLEWSPPGPSRDGRYFGTYVGEPSDGGDWLAYADAENLEDLEDEDPAMWARGDTPATALHALTAKLRDL